MMFRTAETFEYFECLACHSLSLVDVPLDLGRYYSGNYYSMTESTVVEGLRSRLRGVRDAVGAKSIRLGRVFRAGDWTGWLATAGIARRDRILDVGSGRGQRLRLMASAGFRDLTGIDPHLQVDEDLQRVRLLKRGLDELDERFDFIMFNHSFEHIPDPMSTLKLARGHLRPGGRVLIRCPVTPNLAWREYGTDWVQIDAPRHMFLPSVSAMRALSKDAGFTKVDVRFDSTAFQFWGSELYRENMPLSTGSAQFPPDQIEAWARRAKVLNASGDGDQAAFFLHDALRE